jgi:hypothetical protein
MRPEISQLYPQMRQFLATFGMVLALASAQAQVFTGTNLPGTFTNISFVLDVAATNLSITVGGSSSAFSFLMLKRGSAPTDTVYDFSSQTAGQTNGIYLERPELSAGTYWVRVRTPAGSQAHSFTVLVETNRTDVRSASRPVSKTLTTAVNGLVYGGTNQYFRVELTSNAFWRISLDSTNLAAPDLYLARGQIPTTSSSLKRSTGATNDSLALTSVETAPGIYYIGIFAASAPARGLAYAFRIAPVSPQVLTWDPGSTHLGTMTYSNLSGTADDYYFRVTTANPSLGAWRIALRVLGTNDANLYLSRGLLPTPNLADYRSERLGSDGMVLPATTGFQPNEEWFLLVRAKAGATWTLVSGSPYVQDLGTVASDASSSSGEVEIGPEGIRYFSTSPAAEMLAWRLYLNGLPNSFYLRKTSVPLPSLYDQTQAGQMLVVPPYLTVSQYFIGVNGIPHSTINLDSRQHAVTDLAFGASTTVSNTGFGYTTYRVQVPAQQIAWQMYLPSTNGNPNFAVRRNTVPNENNNEAYSELSGTNVVDNVTLVPPILSDGTFYITVYATNTVTTNTHHFNLQNGPATVTDIPYRTKILNDDPLRVGWRFYRVTDITEQLGSLGWDLLLTNATPGTRIALRRNAAPSIWSVRNPSPITANYWDLLSTGDFLQHPAHEADVWYVGVYNSSNALGSFTLTTRDLEAQPLTDNLLATRTNALSGRWEFFSMELKAEDLQDTSPGGGIVGWDVRLTNVISGLPRIVVRRGGLPTNQVSNFAASGSVWPSGAQWPAGADWTARKFSAEDAIDEDGRILVMGVNRPLEAGTYYIGVLNSTGTNALSYQLLSRWIGPNRSIPVKDLAYQGGSATNIISPRDAAYYRVIIPASTPSWKVRLSCVGSEGMLVVCTNRIPTVLPTEKRMQKYGDEQYVLLPYSSGTYLVPGTNYLVVVGEGQSPADSSHIGTGKTSYIIESQGALPETDLGYLMGTDLTVTGSLEGGETAAYHFETLTTTLGFWLTLEDKSGNPVMVSRESVDLADPGLPSDTYGNEGGKTSFAVASSYMIVSAGAAPVETVMVKARIATTNYPDASYTLRVKEIIPDPVSFDGGSFDIVNREADFESFFYIDVPANALGWDLRLANVISGSPRIIVSRDVLPIFSNSTGFNPVPNNPAISTTWPSGARWGVGLDWTERPRSADDVYEGGQVLAMGMYRPLQPGRYYVGVMGDGTAPVSCTLLSRGIGPGFSIPVADLPFAGGSVSVENLDPRQAAYYRVLVPTNAASWKVALTNIVGENLFAVLQGTLPNIGAALNTATTNSGGRKLQKIGDEQFTLLPPPGQDRLFPGYYYLAVVGEGQPGNDLIYIGPGTSSYQLVTHGEAPVRHLGTLGGPDLVETTTLNGGESRIYTFTVPKGTQAIEARLENRVGNPVMVMRGGTRYPDPGVGNTTSTIQVDHYGSDGGENIGNDVNQTFISAPNPTNDLYTLIVKARGTTGIVGVYSNASYTLRVNSSGTIPIEFDNGLGVVSGQAPGTWRYFKVTVPPGVAGWDVRLTDVTSGLPRLAVRRETLPFSLQNNPWGTPGTTSNWPTNYQWAPTLDWTKRSTSVDGLVNEDGRILAMGLGRPLEPGTYYVGVMNSALSANMSYTVRSRGIGTGFAIPVAELPFTGTVTNLYLPVRDAAYYRIVIPSNTPSWKLKLGGLVGESMCAILKNALPNFDTVSPSGTLASGKGMQKLGNEHFVLLPGPGQTNVLAATNYVVVVSEGINPGTSGRIGTGSSAYYLTSGGAMMVKDLGMVTSEDLVQPDTLEGGETKAYRFDVPTGTYGVKLLLENRSGNPMVLASAGDKLPDPGATASGLAAESYGNEGGYPALVGHPTIATIANPVPGTYSVAVKARLVSTSYPDATYTLRVQELLVPEMNFSAEQNTNGLDNKVSGLLQDNERAFFKFVVPATNVNGQPVIGWKLDLSQTNGQAAMRVSRDFLPSDANAANQMNFTNASAVIAPPYLTSGVWFVEVRATGSTSYELTSSPLGLERPPWIMPAPGETNQAIGVVAPTFGQTDIDTNGAPFPKILLKQGSLHYYAIVVPTNNLGLLRATLVAVSGNPDLYLRHGAIPTLYHNLVGAPGSLYERSMLSPNKTEYANWVPVDGKLESKLKPGLWYLAVRAAGNANTEYVLSLSVGDITELPLNAPALNEQLLATGDWKYYRVQTPQTFPLSLNITFSQESGDVLMHLRDVIPPGNGISGTDLKDWQNDAKNYGPYPNFDPPGTYTISAAPVRPGQPLYLGFRCLSDASFSVRIATNGAPVQEPIVVSFYDGEASTTVEPYSSSLFRVDVPPEATRWRHASTHTTNLTVYLDQGTIPGRLTTRWTSFGANTGYTNLFIAWNSSTKQYQPNSWPWVSGQSYFLVVTNTTSAPQDYFIRVDGKNANNDDGDSDGMLDLWEYTYFGTTNNLATADTDNDGNNNLQEFFDATNPADGTAFRAKLFTTALRGTILRDPDLSSYPLGSTVILTPIPSPGYAFIGWSQNATGLDNPLHLVVDGHENITATFKLAGDDFITALPLSGSLVEASFSNVSFTKQSGEPNHAGNPGGKSIWWRWVAPASGPVTIKTVGSVFNTLLGVYTGSEVNSLNKIASDNNSLGGTNRSQVTFTANAGTPYLIAVDGYNGASGKVVLSLSAGSAAVAPRLDPPAPLNNGAWQFTLSGEPNRSYTVQYSTNLANWYDLSTGLSGSAGKMLVTDPAGPSIRSRFYRAVSQ